MLKPKTQKIWPVESPNSRTFEQQLGWAGLGPGLGNVRICLQFSDKELRRSTHWLDTKSPNIQSLVWEQKGGSGHTIYYLGWSGNWRHNVRVEQPPVEIFWSAAHQAVTLQLLQYPVIDCRLHTVVPRPALSTHVVISGVTAAACVLAPVWPRLATPGPGSACG